MSPALNFIPLRLLSLSTFIDHKPAGAIFIQNEGHKAFRKRNFFEGKCRISSNSNINAETFHVDANS